MLAPFTASDDRRFAELIADRERLRRLCDDIERCADALPALPDRQGITELCRGLHRLGQDVPLGEATLFLHFRDCAGNHPATAALLAQIAGWRALDGMHADDLAAALTHVAGKPQAPQPTELGYMLRCCFDATRRIAAFEALALLVIGEGHLSPAQHAALLASAAAR